MTGHEHYVEAERLLTDAGKIVRRADDECPEADRMIAEAHVHATLALAAATAMPKSPPDFQPHADEVEWARVSSATVKATS
jgi:hypothetical protein